MRSVPARPRVRTPESAPAGSGHQVDLVRHIPLYVLGGAVSTGLQALLFLLLRDPLTPAVANPVAIGVTTVLNTEFHKRLTFADVTGPRSRRHLQTVGTFLFYACAGTAALGLLHLLAADPSPMTETAVLVATSLVGGVLRFIVLRSWVFVWSREPRATS